MPPLACLLLLLLLARGATVQLAAAAATYGGPVSLRTLATAKAARPIGAAAAAAAVATAAALSRPRSALASSAGDGKAFESLSSAAAFIEANCRTMVKAARATGLVLYRGETQLATSSPSLITTRAGDLLDPKTYQKDSEAAGVAAADYFAALDKALDNGSIVRNGHIATSSQREASVWGPIYSIWPSDDGLRYASMSKYSKLWDDDWSTPQGSPAKLGAFFWRGPKMTEFIKDNVRIDYGLESALSSQHEVVFTAPKGFVAVPVSQEYKLLELLGIEAFSPEIKPSRAKDMTVDDVPIKLSRERFIIY